MTRTSLLKARRLVAEALIRASAAVDETRSTGILYEIGDVARHALAAFETALVSTDGTRRPLPPPLRLAAV